MAVIVLISLSASISAMTLPSPRVTSRRTRTARSSGVRPSSTTVIGRLVNSIIAQALWSSLLVLSAQAQSLINYTGFAIWLFSGVAVVALFVLRAKEPNAERPFRAWGYPFLPGLYAVAAALVVLNARTGAIPVQPVPGRSSSRSGYRCISGSGDGGQRPYDHWRHQS